MRTTFLVLSVLLSAITLVVVNAAQAQQQLDPAKMEFFENKIRPVLSEHCYECHSNKGEEPEGGLRLDSRGGMLKGGETGPAMFPGDAERSLIIEALRHESLEMPPEKRLPDAVIGDFVRWIGDGAIDPRTETSLMALPRKPMSGAPDHWSFQPLADEEVPRVSSADWPYDDIDRFVLARMQQHGLSPVEDANPQALIRRAYFTLIGLPPSQNDVEAFETESIRHPRRAFRDLVDRLLASPEFGVRWGRHWLDVVRYAESSGFERNFTFPHAWRYRDYVVRSFNEDKPYDRFIQEQIAGDLLPAENELQAQQQQIGAGMLTLGPKNLLGNTQQFPLDLADDQINVTGRAILGLTVACARCHDHKFDPITTEEYYAMAGIFLSTETMYGTNPGSGGGSNKFPSDLLPIGADALEKHQAYRAHKEKADKLTLTLGKAQGRLKRIRDQKINPQDKTRAKVTEDAVAEVRKLQQQLNQLKSKSPAPPAYAMSVREAKQPVDAAVRLRGVPNKKGVVAPRGFLRVLSPGKSHQIPPQHSGRFEFAQWLTSRDNPLTARVIVNRVWRHLFGRGIVESVDNFGFNGSRPTHRQLLDHLAVRFMDQGWSVKTLIREIMLSRVYQLGSNYRSDNAARDGENRFLWRMTPRRLEAEAIRDAMLAVSGELALGAPKFGSVVAQVGDGCLVRQIKTEKLDVELPHRSIYLPMARHIQPEILQAFDGPAASLVVGDRDSTNVPAQSLFLLNNPFVVEQSLNTARRLLLRQDDDGSTMNDHRRVEQVYWSALGRPPTSEEIELAISFIREIVSPNSDSRQDTVDNHERRLSAWAALCQALFTCAEFRTVF